MIDITKKYDWNNPKTMNMDRLYNTFITLTQSDQGKVFKLLRDNRAESLLNKINKEKKLQIISDNEKLINTILKPLSSCIDLTNIRSYDEAILVYSIVKNRINLKHHEVKYPHYNDEQENFNDAKEKMLEWITKITDRSEAYLENEVLYDLLNNFNYVHAKSKADLEQEIRANWKSIFKKLDTKITLAKNIVVDLIGFLRLVDGIYLNTEDKNILNAESEKIYNLINNQENELNRNEQYQKLKNMYKHNELNINYKDDYVTLTLKLSAWTFLLDTNILEDGTNLLNKGTHLFEDGTNILNDANNLLMVYDYPENYVVNINQLTKEGYTGYIERVKNTFLKYGEKMPLNIELKIQEVNELLKINNDNQT